MNHNALPAPSDTREFENKKDLVLVPVEQATVAIAQNPQELTHWTKAMTYNINNGIVQSSAEGQGVADIAVADPDYITKLESQGYQQDPSAAVDIGNGLHPAENTEVMPRLVVNRAARQSGAQNREATFVDHSGVEQTYVTSNPFEQGEFLEVNRAMAEVGSDGAKIWHVDLAHDKVADPDFVENIGKWNENNGVIEVITTDGNRQITKATDARRQRLLDMGYAQNPAMAVAHSNGEQWNTDIHWTQISNTETGLQMGTAPEIWDRIESV